MAHELETLLEGIQAPLGALPVVGGVSVVLEICIVLVETVVCQMDVLLLSQIAIPALIVLLGSKSGQAVFIYVQSEWIDRGHRHIDSQVKLVAVDQQRLIDVLADNHLGPLWYLIDVLSDEDALALRGGGRFADPRLVGLLGHGVLQLNHLVWEDESVGEEFEMSLAMSLSHAGQVAIHLILAGHLCALGEVVDLLVACQ